MTAISSAKLDLPLLARSRLLDTISSVAAGAARCVLLLDEHTVKIVSAAVRLSELHDRAPQVTLVESVHTPRAVRAPPELAPSLDAVYFITPTARSLRAALDDYSVGGDAPPAAYGGAVHLIFTRRLPDELLELVRSSPAVVRVRTLRELHLDFIAIRPAAFSLGAPSALRDLFAPHDPAFRAGELQRLAEQVATLFATLGQRAPRVRFAANGHPVGREFAERLSAVLSTSPADGEAERHGKADTDDAARAARLAPVRDLEGSDATLLVLDRSFDQVTPLLHDFSLEALAEGLGVLRHGRFVRSTVASASTSLAPKEALFENSQVWSQLRLLPFEQASLALRRLAEAFVADNKSAVRAQRGEDLSAQQRQEASRAQLAFAYVKRRDELKLAEEVLSVVTGRLIAAGSKTPLYAQLLLEQDLATRRELDGSELKRADASLRLAESLAVLRDRAVLDRAAAAAVAPTTGGNSPCMAAWGLRGAAARGARAVRDQRRLLALCAACHQPTQAEVGEALAAAGLPVEDHLPVLRTLTYMSLAADSGSAGSMSWDRGLPWKRGRTLPDSEVELGRHVPKVKLLLESALRKGLSAADYPYADGMPPPDSACATAVAVEGGCIGGAVGEVAKPELVGAWAFRRKAAQGTAVGDTPPRVFVMIIGGASYAEVRCAAEVGGDGQVGFGCTELLTPLAHLAAMEEAGRPAPLCAGFGTAVWY